MVWRIAATLLVVAGGTLVVVRNRGADEQLMSATTDSASLSSTPTAATKQALAETAPALAAANQSSPQPKRREPLPIARPGVSRQRVAAGTAQAGPTMDLLKADLLKAPISEPQTSAPKTFKAVLLLELDQKKLFIGQKIRITHLYFKADSINLQSDSYKVLNELADYLKAYPKTIIEIGGHTNTIPSQAYCNELSTARAKSVQEYLISQGVPSERLHYKGYGKQDPLIPYDKYNKEARWKNQRVEIKILSLY